MRHCLKVLLSSTSVLFVLASQPATAQQQQPQLQPGDEKITMEAIGRACREVHHAPQAEPEWPTAGVYGIEIHCRLVSAAGATRAQISPSEVCQRQTGSTSWVRLGGTEVYCRAGQGESQSKAAGSGRAIQPEDVARVCRDKHSNPQATAELPMIGRFGVELKCRLTNAGGFTMAEVSPDDVCRDMTGNSAWFRMDAQIFCRGTWTVVQPSSRPEYERDAGPPRTLPPRPEANVAPERGAESGDSGPPRGRGVDGKSRDTPVNAQTLGPGCGEVKFGKASMSAPASGAWFGPVPFSIACGGRQLTPEQACREAAGVSEWYLGFGPKVTLYCRTAPRRTEDAAGDVWRACLLKGSSRGASNGNGTYSCGYANSRFAISPAEICQTLFGTRGTSFDGGSLRCLP